jgi:hypothetical protein
MFARNLEIGLSSLCHKADVSFAIDDMAQRFDALRRNGKLPIGRERRAQRLTISEIAAAILGLAQSTRNGPAMPP